MSVVGEFPGLQNPNFKTHRAPTNPMDKSTLVSILPKLIHEVKLTIVPSVFKLEPGSYKEPSILVVGGCSWWREIDENQPILEIPQSSVVLAHAIVQDYCGAVLGASSGSASPGFFFIPGEINYTTLITKHKNALDLAKKRQDKWYETLVKMADSLWARSNGNPLAIPDDARLAAQELQIKDKPWMQDFTTLQLVNCFSCGHLVNPSYPVCSNCKAIVNKELATSLDIKFAV